MLALAPERLATKRQVNVPGGQASGVSQRTLRLSVLPLTSVRAGGSRVSLALWLRRYIKPPAEKPAITSVSPSPSRSPNAVDRPAA